MDTPASSEIVSKPTTEGASTQPAPIANPAKSSRRRRWIRRLAVCLMVLGCLYTFRAPILRQVGSFLIVDDPLPSSFVVLVLSGDRWAEHAADLYKSGAASAILMITPRAGKLQRYGILPTAEHYFRRRLSATGVPDAALEVVNADAFSEWQGLMFLNKWMSQHPSVEIVALCHHVATRRCRYIVNQTLDADNAKRLHFKALPHRWYDATDWWRNKDGIKDVGSSYLSLAYVWIHREQVDEWHDWTPEQYEQSLR